ncbi:hypothetical protein [Rurimicrobium arvi]
MNKGLLRIAAVFLLFLQTGVTYAQTKIKDGTIASSSLPNVNAILELESNKRGVVFPRLALISTNSASPLTTFLQGMIVYNTATAGTPPTDVKPGFYYSNGVSWIRFSTDLFVAEPAIIAPNTPKTYYNGFKNFVFFNSDSVTEGAANLYFTPERARAAINLSTSGNSGAATYDATSGALNVPNYTLIGLGGEPEVAASNTPNQYWNGFKNFVTLNSDSVAEGSTNQYFTDTRARGAISVTTTGTGSASYDATTGVLNIPTGSAAITAPSIPNQYWNGFKEFVTLNSDSVTEGSTNQYYTNTRARNAINVTTTGNNGATTYDATSGALNVPNYTLIGLGGEPEVAASNTPNQYWNGFKVFVTLNSDSVTEGLTNQYYSDTRARGAISVTTTGTGSASYDAATGVLNIPTGSAAITAPGIPNQYWNGFKEFVTLNSDSVTEGSTNQYYTNTRARNAINVTTTGNNGAATYDATSGALNVPNYTLIGLGGEPEVAASNTPNQYWNGFKEFVTLNSDSVTEGPTNQYYTNTRARSAINVTTTGNSGAATYDAISGALNVPNYTLIGLGGEPEVAASNTPNQYWNGFKEFVTLNSDSVTEGSTNQYYTNTRARNAINVTTTGNNGAATYDATSGALNVPNYTLIGLGGEPEVAASNTNNQYWNGFKEFVTLNSDSVAEGSTNQYYTNTRARSAISVTTTGTGSASYDATTGVLNIPTGSAAITAPSIPNQYWNGFKEFVTLNSDSVTEGSTNQYYTNTRARNAIGVTTTGNSGAATYDATSGALNVPNYTLIGLGGEPEVAASNTPNQYWNGFKEFVTLNSDSVTEGSTNQYYTNTRARNAISVTTTGTGSASYDATTGVLNIPTGSAAITASGLPNQYWNGFKNFVTLNSDSVTEGTANRYYTDTRSRSAISITTTGNNGAATYTSATGVFNVPAYTLSGLGGEPSITAPNTTKKYYNGYKQFVTLNSDSVTEGTTNQFYTNTRARGAISITTTGSSGAATYTSSTGVLNVPNYTLTGLGGEPAVTASNTVKQYYNGYKKFVALNSDSLAEGTTNQFYTNTRARGAISITTTGSSGAATYTSSTGVLNVPNYTLTGLGGEPTVTASNTAKQYYNGYKKFVALNSDSVTQGTTNLYSQWKTSGTNINYVATGASVSVGTTNASFTTPANTGSSIPVLGVDGTVNATNFTTAVQSLVDGATITWDLSRGANAVVTLGGAGRTLSVTNPKAGMYGSIIVKQDATGGRTITSLPAGSKVAGGSAGQPSLTVAANAVDMLTFFYDGSTFWWIVSSNFN